MSYHSSDSDNNDEKDEMQVEDLPFPDSDNYLTEWQESLTKLLTKKKPLEQIKRSQLAITKLAKGDPSIDSKHQKYLLTEYLPRAVKAILGRE